MGGNLSNRPGPARRGSVEPLKRADGSLYFRARIRLADDTRVRVDVPEKYSTPAGGKTGRERAELYAEARQEQEDEDRSLLAEKRAREAETAKQNDPRHGETCTKYRQRLEAYRKEMGKRGGDADRRTWTKWISPLLGAVPIAKAARDDIEKVRDRLDDNVATHKRTGGKEGISGKRAFNIWTIVTTTFKAACMSKRRDLRVRDDNPCAGVLPPERSESRRRTFIYPNEFSALLACEDVPLEWRELYAVACYLYLRPGELRALLRSDIDLEAGVVHITKAFDELEKEVKTPKTRNGIRDVPIHPSLDPLLRRMHARTKDGAPIAPIMATRSSFERARNFRAHMAKAGASRSRLTENTPTTMQINFRSLRDSGITWLALAGVDLAKIQRRAGHDLPQTTMGYVKAAEDLSGAIGEPFPTLPASMIGASEAPSATRVNWARDWAKSRAAKRKLMNRKSKSASPRGFEPLLAT